jgi:hypothetical protein
MKELALLTALALMLSGCAYPLQLHSRDGSAGGAGEASSTDRSMRVNVGGKLFTGSYIFDSGSVIATQAFGTATAVSGTRSAQAFGSSYGTAFIPGSNMGQAFLRAEDGTSMRCQFRYINSSGLGECIDSQNKVYDLVIGSPR